MKTNLKIGFYIWLFAAVFAWAFLHNTYDPDGTIAESTWSFVGWGGLILMGICFIGGLGGGIEWDKPSDDESCPNCGSKRGFIYIKPNWECKDCRAIK